MLWPFQKQTLPSQSPFPKGGVCGRRETATSHIWVVSIPPTSPLEKRDSIKKQCSYYGSGKILRRMKGNHFSICVALSLQQHSDCKTYIYVYISPWTISLSKHIKFYYNHAGQSPGCRGIKERKKNPIICDVKCINKTMCV